MTIDHELHHTAWQMQQDGYSWSEISRELGCKESVAQAMAERFVRDNEAEAHASQVPLFDL
ncbi:hypothetical protein BO226_25345 (plasmid) [Rhodococcus sp. 2G]|uniref:hypothetical protein n=1 Tax=Rhodococcus TaxID=1827 RepID=UPI0007DA0875|nr:MULTISPECIES: hypothetical protein [Rhodococcus]APE12677.1 hypothetical protein BO226_25345 [Rhodococcus sp. 2G]